MPYFDVKLNRYPIKSQGTAHENWWLKTTTHLVDQGNWLLDKVKGWNIPIINNRINRIETNIGIIEEMILREYQLKKPIYDFLAGTGMGIGRAGLDMVLGLWELVTDPIGTIKA
ncbi:hypothetical protein [Bacillus sp. JCM 19034]|uniref:hypothetical protein n=1 Tax=Bacillus sp. JCM 19034 TaxID=1481928 RepID=UPI0007842AE9|nr:hypothetical protein [Bacillus sp. JCM 19034]